MTEVEAQTEATSYYGLVKQFVGQFMTMAHDGGDPTPMQWIYQTRSHGFKMRYTTPAARKIQWIRDEVLYPGKRVQMSQLKSVLHGMTGEAREEWFGKLMVVTDDGGRQARAFPASIGTTPSISHRRPKLVSRFWMTNETKLAPTRSGG
mgnify:CR=1 FL=1